MQYIDEYNSKLGKLIISSNDKYLTGIWFINQKHFPNLDKSIKKETSVIKKTKEWLDIYFQGIEPSFTLPIALSGTEFQKQVWEVLITIPYGMTMTYKEVAELVAKKRKVKKMSYQAVGNAIGCNKISIVVPCHRLIGTNNNLVGYAAGVNIKQQLLELEKQSK